MRTAMLWLGLLVGCLCEGARAAEPTFDRGMLDVDDRGMLDVDDRGMLDVDEMKEYGAGVRRHQLDERTRLLGWRLNDRWYFGRRKGDDSDALGLIWQKGDTQISLSPEGIGWRRQFSLH